MVTKAITERVVVCRAYCGLCAMQACAVKDATDEEILAVCNRDNPSGTSNGWSLVIRNKENSRTEDGRDLPVQCEEYPNRMHFMVIC